ncbi:MAG: Sec-independent protein translocase protein TatB [Bradyrhizobium sp.]
MFDFSFGELAVISAVALVVLGPERLPKVARTVGEWAGKAQRYVSQVKADINREMELTELKKLQEQARGIANEFQTSVESSVKGLQDDVSSAVADPTIAVGESTKDYAWEGAGEQWMNTRFQRRYKAGPSVNDLAEEIGKLKRQLALPDASTGPRHRYAPRARVSRPRIRR